MYLGQCSTCRRPNPVRQFRGLGFWEALIPIAGQAIAGAFADDKPAPSGGSQGGFPMQPQPQPVNVVTTVSPEIVTQVSPNISPVFQQQWQPQSSPATASTTQLPVVPAQVAHAVNQALPVPYSTTDPISGMYGASFGMPAQSAPSSQSWLIPLALFGAAGFLLLRKKS